MKGLEYSLWFFLSFTIAIIIYVYYPPVKFWIIMKIALWKVKYHVRKVEKALREKGHIEEADELKVLIDKI